MTVTLAPSVSPAAGRSQRLASVDVVRGIVMVLMAIDHVRVYSGVPAGGADAGVFLTRWVTHFCAPVFVFLAGASAYLYARGRPTRDVAAFLATRGLLLIALEFTVIRASWTFGVDYSQFLLAGVIWMLGVCMVLMAALVWLPTWALGVLGVAIIAGQDAFRALPAGPIAQLLYGGGEIQLGADGPSLSVLYTILPWIGVMAAGYAFGAILTLDAAARRRWCLRIGLGATALFIASGLASALAAASDSAPPLWMRLLNQRKYPASQLFLLMTLGPAIALMPLAEKWCQAPFLHASKKWCLAPFFETFGRVPMFYYVLHIPVIHALALLVWKLRDGAAHGDWFATAPYVFVPPGQRWSLALVYVVFALAIAVLYPMCRWYGRRKIRYF